MRKEFSGNEVKRLGKALRDGPVTPDLLMDLEDYRATFDPLLIDLSLQIERLLNGCGVPFLLTGRSKRTKSIIRKLKRPQNHGMDLSRMGDIVGLRVIVGDLAAQERVLEELKKFFEVKEIHDYRESLPPSGYRCVHILVRDGKKIVEIQLRSLAQHVWAVESESLGEKVKEGTTIGRRKEYLDALKDAIIKFEEDSTTELNDAELGELGSSRSPMKALLPRLSEQFAQATETQPDHQEPYSYLLVYDTRRAVLIQNLRYESENRSEALENYSAFSRMLDEERFDIIVLNASSTDGLRVTHPRFFS